MGSEPEVVHLIILMAAANAHAQVMSQVNKIKHSRVISLRLKTEMRRPKPHSRVVPRREVNDMRWSASYCHKRCTVLEFPYAAWLKMLQNIEYIRAATFWQQAEKCCGWGRTACLFKHGGQKHTHMMSMHTRTHSLSEKPKSNILSLHYILL